MKKVLITGAAGFLGSQLSERFLKDGFQVFGMDNFITGSRRNLEYLNHPNFTFIEADVCEKREWKQKLDRIYYLASPASPIDYIELPFETLFVGSYGCHNYLELAKKTGAKRRLHKYGISRNDKKKLRPQARENLGEHFRLRFGRRVRLV